MRKTFISVAIDGPAGAGKSTLAKSAAAELGYVYVDTGAIYRTIGYFVRSRGVDPADRESVKALLPEAQVEMSYGQDGLQHMLLNGEDVTEAIRLPEISAYASAVSAHPVVRDFLMDMQRSMARTRNVVMDGRDIGTVVLPEADVKIFLTAAPEVRAERRCRELAQRGTPEPYEQVLAEIQKRDWNDTHRAAAPLRAAADAVTVDTSGLNFEESRQALLRVIRKKVGA